MLKIGQRVKHRAGEFNFIGEIIGICRTKNGGILAAVEEENSHYTALFGMHSLDAHDEPVVVKVPVVRQVTLPYEIYIPVKAIPADGFKRRATQMKVEAEYLQKKPFELLVREKVHAEVEFHFSGTRAGDLDNLLKPTLDMLKGSVLVDDGQIVSMSSKIVEHSEKEGFSIRLTAYAKAG